MLFTTNTLRWLEEVLQERFGHRYTLMQSSELLTLSLPGSEAKITFDHLQKIFHQSRSNFPCEYWKPSTEGYEAPIKDSLAAPSEHPLSTPLIECHELGATVHYDILGCTYWMLTRMEEIGRVDLDEHQRFPASSSHAFKFGYLERPVVDEWMEILGQVIKIVWPNIRLKSSEFTVRVSHDVDYPSRYQFLSYDKAFRSIGKSIIKHHNYKEAWLIFKTRFLSGSSLMDGDPYNTFHWLFKTSERFGVKSAFYFFAGSSNKTMDANYDLEDASIKNLIKEITARGHEIGLHPSYDSYLSDNKIHLQFLRLLNICRGLGIQQEEWGGRMHYLRWSHPYTLNQWADAGLNYDSTLGYADNIGFRCGTCFEYPAFDPVDQKRLSLRVRPLIVMETVLLNSKYMNLGTGSDALHRVESIIKKCRAVSGTSTLLWHNSSLNTPQEKELYINIIRKCTRI